MLIQVPGALLLALVAAVQTEPAPAQEAQETQEEPPRAPGSAVDAAIAHALLEHAYFRRITLERVERPPYLFLVQHPSDPAAGRAADVAARTLALVEPARGRFEREIAKPLGLARRADVPLLIVVVLADRAEYEECYRATPGAWHFDVDATFARELGAAVLYDDPAGDPGERARSAQHALVHVLQHACRPADAPAPVRSWTFEGMADRLSRAEGDALAAPERVLELVQDAASPATRWAHLRTLEEMCAVDEPLRLEEFFQERTPSPALAPGSDADPWTAFYREATLLYAFLAGDERLRPGLARWNARTFGGEHSPEAFVACFAPKTGAELDGAFLAWVVREARHAFPAEKPAEKIDEKLVLAALGREDLRVAAAPASPKRASKPAPKIAAPTGSREPPPALTFDDLTSEERFARTLIEIGAGRLRAGRAHLAELAAESTGELRARIEREERRAAAWESARDAFLARVVGDKSLLELDLGPRVSAHKFGVRSASEGLLELDDKKGGIRRVPVETLDPLVLARHMANDDGGEAWPRFYLYVLRGDERWKKLLQPDGGEASALRLDAEEDYPPRLAVGRALATLQAFAVLPPTDEPKEIDRRIELLRGLLREAGTNALVGRERPALRAHAQALLEQKCALGGAAAVLAGKLETPGKGRVRLTYAFDDPRELDDFSVDPYPLVAPRTFDPEQATDVPFQVANGGLTAQGTASLRTLYDLAAPLSVRYDLTFAQSKAAKPTFYLALGICDDGREHFLWAINHNILQLQDTEGSVTSEEDAAILLGHPYPLELLHDGVRATFRCAGKDTTSLGTGSRQTGAIFLYAASDLQVRIEKLVIEGELPVDGLDRFYRTWAARQLAGM